MSTSRWIVLPAAVLTVNSFRLGLCHDALFPFVTCGSPNGTSAQVVGMIEQPDVRGSVRRTALVYLLFHSHFNHVHPDSCRYLLLRLGILHGRREAYAECILSLHSLPDDKRYVANT